MAEKLLPCPFCGSESIHQEDGETFRWVRMVCADCGASCGDVRVGQDLAEAWNTRNNGNIQQQVQADNLPEMCEECGKYPADTPSKLCCGCDAYKDHY